MKIKVGEYDLIDKGTIIAIPDEPIDFVIREDIGMTIRIIFKTDKEIEGTKITVEGFDKKGATFIYNNFNNSLGMGTVKPVKIGNLNERELFFSYRIYSLEGAGHTLHYNWLAGKEVKDDK